MLEDALAIEPSHEVIPVKIKALKDFLNTKGVLRQKVAMEIRNIAQESARQSGRNIDLTNARQNSLMCVD